MREILRIASEISRREGAMSGETGLADRLREMIGDGSGRAFAAAAGVNEGTLRSVLNGTRPSVDFVVSVATAHGVSIAWLAAGEGSKLKGRPGPIDTGHLRDSLLIVEEWLENNDRTLEPAKKAEVVTQLYEFIVDDATQGRGPINVERLHRILRLVA